MSKFNKFIINTLAGIGLAFLLSVAYVIGHNYGRDSVQVQMHQFCAMQVPLKFNNDNRVFLCAPKQEMM